MAESLTLDGRGAIANWQKRELGQGTRIQVAAFQGLIRDVFGSHTLCDKLHLVGDAFRHSKELRNDSNYESLVLAYQYWHDPGVKDNPVNVDHEFAMATEAMSKVSASVLQFVVAFLQKSICESKWIAANSHFESQAVYGLVLMYVRDKIIRYSETSSDGSATVSEWCGGLGSLAEDVECATHERVGPAMALKKFIAYGLFNLKSGMLIGFQNKADNLMQAALSLDPRPSLPRSLDEVYQVVMSHWTNIGGRFDSTARGVSWIMDADHSNMRPRIFIRFGTMGLISIAKQKGELKSLLDTYYSKLMESPAMAKSVAQGKWSVAYQDVSANDLQIILGAVMWLAEQSTKGI